MKRFLMRWSWVLNLVFFVAMVAWTANNLIFGPWQAAISPAIVAGVNAYALFLWWRGRKPESMILWAQREKNSLFLYTCNPNIPEYGFDGYAGIFTEGAKRFPALRDLKPEDPPVKVRLEVLE